MIILSPEFHRNIWLKFSAFRLIAMPLLITLAVVILVNLEEKWYEVLLWPSIIGYFFIVIVWGTYDAASSLRDEIKNNTWDFQKMSLISPWQLLVGKLFGATSYVWYFGCALLCVIAYSYANYQVGVPSSTFVDTPYFGDVAVDEFINPPRHETVFLLMFLILGGIAGHAAALMASLLNAKEGRTEVIMPFIIGMIAGYFVFQFGLSAMETLSPRRTMFERNPLRSWFEISMPVQVFWISTVLFFLYWLIAGIYRNLREELQYKNTPIVWLFFSITLAIYVMGLWQARTDDMLEFLGYPLALAYVAILILTYAALVSEAGKLTNYKRFFKALSIRNVHETLENTPKWVVSCFVLLCMWPILLTILPMFVEDKKWTQHTETPWHIFLLLFTLSLMVARDGLIIHAIMIGQSLKHSKFVLIVYYVLIYVIIPLMAVIIFDGGFEGRNDRFFRIDGKSQGALSWFFPGGFSSIIPMFCQIGLAAYLLRLRLTKLKI